MKMIKFLILLVIVMFATPVLAEIYKYVDEQGRAHFTDDINQVPEGQRDSLEASPAYEPDTEAEEEYTETASNEAAESEDFRNDDDGYTDADLESSYADEPETTPGFDDDSDNQEDVAQTQDGDSLNLSDNGQNELSADLNRLEALKKEIDKEYAALVKEKKKLTEEQKSLTTREDILKFNAKVDNLNKRTEAYVQKGKQYRAYVEAYNERVIQRNAQLNQKKK